MRLLVLALFLFAFWAPGISKEASFRCYDLRVSKEEKEHVSYIICTMGFKSLPKIWSERSSLKKSGDKVDHIHPLKFLMCVFTDEEMKAAMGNLQGRSFVWNEFKKGLFQSLEDETRNNNISPEHIEDFANKIKIQSHLIVRPIQQERWDEFISLLIKHVPREGDPKRYDM